MNFDWSDNFSFGNDGGGTKDFYAALLSDLSSTQGDMQFTRASGQYVADATGALQYKATNVPAFASGGGILLEPASTNKCTCYGVPRADSTSAELVDTANSAAAWTPAGATTIADDGADGIKITYVDTASAALINLSNAGGLNTDLVVGQQYQVTYSAKVNTGSVTVRINSGTVSLNDSAVTSTTFVDINIKFMAVATAHTFAVRGMGAGEIIWVKNISVKAITDNTGIASNHNGTAFNQNIPNMTLSGDAAAVLSIVTDETELKAAKLDHLTNGYKVYKATNPSASTSAAINLSGSVTSGVTSTISVFYRQSGYASAGDILLRFNNTAIYGTEELTSTTYTMATLTGTPTAKNIEFVLKPNMTLYFLLPCIEEQPFTTSLMPTLGTTAARALTLLKTPTSYIIPSGGKRFSQYWTPLGYKVGTIQYIMSSYSDANNYTACWYNGVIVCVEKKVAGVSEYVTFPLTAVLGQRYLVEMLAYPDGTMGLMVDGVSAQSGLNELITLADNRDFTSDTGFWTKGATTTISGGTASVASAGNEVMLFRVNLATAHKLYLATYTIVSVTGQIRVQQGSGTTTIHSTAGTYSDYMSITLNTDGNVSWHSIGAITASIDNISYKEVYNNTTNATMPVFGTTIEIGSFNGGTNAFAVLSDVRIGGI